MTQAGAALIVPLLAWFQNWEVQDLKTIQKNIIHIYKDEHFEGLKHL